MLQGEHSAILSTFIKLPFVIKTFVLHRFLLYLGQSSVCFLICSITVNESTYKKLLKKTVVYQCEERGGSVAACKHEIERSLVRASPEAPHCVHEQETLSSA